MQKAGHGCTAGLDDSWASCDPEGGGAAWEFKTTAAFELESAATDFLQVLSSPSICLSSATLTLGMIMAVCWSLCFLSHGSIVSLTEKLLKDELYHTAAFHNFRYSGGSDLRRIGCEYALYLDIVCWRLEGHDSLVSLQGRLPNTFPIAVLDSLITSPLLLLPTQTIVYGWWMLCKFLNTGHHQICIDVLCWGAVVLHPQSVMEMVVTKWQEMRKEISTPTWLWNHLYTQHHNSRNTHSESEIIIACLTILHKT